MFPRERVLASLAKYKIDHDPSASTGGAARPAGGVLRQADADGQAGDARQPGARDHGVPQRRLQQDDGADRERGRRTGGGLPPLTAPPMSQVLLRATEVDQGVRRRAGAQARLARAARGRGPRAGRRERRREVDADQDHHRRGAARRRGDRVWTAQPLRANSPRAREGAGHRGDLPAAGAVPRPDGGREHRARRWSGRAAGGGCDWQRARTARGELLRPGRRARSTPRPTAGG